MKLKLVLLTLLLFVPILAYPQAMGIIAAGGTDCTTTSACLSLPLPAGTSTVGVQLAGTFNATIQFEGTTDGTNYIGTSCTPQSGTAGTSATTTGLWQCSVAGMSVLRLRSSTFTSGSAMAFMVPSTATTPGAVGNFSGNGLATSANQTNGQQRAIALYGDATPISQGDVVLVAGTGTVAAPDSRIVTVQGPALGSANAPILVTGTVFTSTANSLLLPCNALRRTFCK